MPSTVHPHNPYPYATIYPTTYASHLSNDNLRSTADCSQSTSQPSASSAMQRQNTVSVQAALPASHTATTCMYSPSSAHPQIHMLAWSHGHRHLYTTTYNASTRLCILTPTYKTTTYIAHTLMLHLYTLTRYTLDCIVLVHCTDVYIDLHKITAQHITQKTTKQIALHIMMPTNTHHNQPYPSTRLCHPAPDITSTYTPPHHCRHCNHPHPCQPHPVYTTPTHTQQSTL